MQDNPRLHLRRLSPGRATLTADPPRARRQQCWLASSSTRRRRRRDVPHKDPEKKRAYNKAYNEANKEEIKAQRKEYQQANKEAISVQRRDYREANKGVISVIARTAWCVRQTPLRDAIKSMIEAVSDDLERARQYALQLSLLADAGGTRYARDLRSVMKDRTIDSFLADHEDCVF